MSRTYEQFRCSAKGRKELNQDYCRVNAMRNFSIIADGVSECQRSGEASFTAVLVGFDFITRKIKLGDGHPREWVSEAMRTAGDFVYGMNVIKDDQGDIQVAKNGRTTLDIALIHDHVLYVAHIGDGRVYAVDKSGRLELLTKDHTNSRGELERFLGRSPGAEFDAREVPLDNYKMVYLATDGIYKFVSDEETRGFLNKPASLNQILDNLFERAKNPVAVAEELSRKHGVPVRSARATLISRGDNMTASIIRWGED